MAESKAGVGRVVWRDLTVADAGAVKDFYTAVVGWEARDHQMGDYADFDILDGDGEVVAGICHARGENAGMPAQWLVYVTVEDVEASVARCRELGGEVMDGPRKMGESGFCVIRDPAGAVLALIEGQG